MLIKGSKSDWSLLDSCLKYGSYTVNVCFPNQCDSLAELFSKAVKSTDVMY